MKTIKKSGFSTIEIMMAVLVMSVIVIVVTRMLSMGLKGGKKGTAHLSIIQNSMVLMSQFDLDLQRAVSIIQPTPGNNSPEAMFEVYVLDSNGKLATSTIKYRANPGQKGFSRCRLDSGGNTVENQTFCRENLTLASFTHAVDSATGKVGMIAAFHLHASTKGSEDFFLKRYIYCPVLASNSRGTSWKGQ
ncbi:MAG: hypothetical protein HQM10_14630 [Candidatus Riflebacteria bacterium]|nr:hypothetical protein [Candidatus Riflebacteria bacterium]